jgi:uncharacterized membrane protein YfcA
MTLNQKAALQTLAIIVAIIGGSLGTTYLLSLLGPQAPAIAGCALLLGMFVYMTFGIVKNRLEYNQKLEEINKK